MAERDGKPLSLWAIAAIVIGTAVVLGALNGLYAERLGISRSFATGITGGLIAGLAGFLARRRQRALSAR